MKYYFLLVIFSLNAIFSAASDQGDDKDGKKKQAINLSDTATIGLLTRIAGDFDISNPGELDSALFYLNKALIFAREIKADDYYYTIYERYTQVFMKSGNYSLALEYYFKMLKLLDESISSRHDTVSNYKRYASLYISIGNCYFNMDNFKSMDYYLKSLEVVKKLSDIDPGYPALEREMMICVNIGSAYLNNYEFAEAELYFEKALELNDSLYNPVIEGSLYNNLGIVFKEKNDFDKALNYYEKSLKIREEVRDSIGQAQTLNNLGDVYYLTGHFKHALEVLNQAFLLSRQTGNLRSQMKAANFLSIAFEKTGDYKKALEMYKVFTTLHDSIISNESVQNAIRQELQYQYEKQLRENDLQQQLLLANKERKALIYMVISGVLLFSVVILILLFRNQKMKVRQAELEKQKLEMDLNFRNKELSTHVIYLLQKNEFISSIMEKLLLLKKSTMDEAMKNAWIQEIMGEMQSNIDHTVWNEFEVRFQQVHNDFYRKLNEKYPDLTPNEIKICAFLKLNMTTKDISAITFQSVKSIQVARNRLRKKMGIERDENLVLLLQQL